MASMGMPIGMILTMLMTGGLVSNDLLSYMDTSSYWQIKAVEVSAETMTAELSRPVNEAEPAQVRAVRKLMAIRTLGELKAKSALPALRKLSAAKEPFVKEYATWAIGAITGKTAAKPPTKPAAAAAKLRQNDLALLPTTCGVAAQMNIRSAGPMNLDRILPKDMESISGGADRKTILAEATKAVLKVAESIGNARLDAVTIGFADDVGDDSGFAVIVARGFYDVKAARAALAKGAREVTDTGGAKIYRVDRNAAVLLPNSTRAVLIVGPNAESLPIEQVVSAMKAGKSGLQNNASLAKLVKAIGTDHPLWAVARMTEAYREATVLAPFETLTLVAKRAKDATDLKLEAAGKDATEVAAAVAEFRDSLDEALDELSQMVEHMPTFKPVIDFLKSIRTNTEGANVTVTARMKGSPQSLLGGLFSSFLGARARADRHFEEVRQAPPPPDDDF